MKIDYDEYDVLFDYLMPGEKQPSESKRVSRLVEIYGSFTNGDLDLAVSLISQSASKSNDLLSVKSAMMKIHISFFMKSLDPNQNIDKSLNIRRVNGIYGFDHIFSDDLVSWYAQVLDYTVLADFSGNPNNPNQAGMPICQWGCINNSVILNGQWVVDLEVAAKWIFELKDDEFDYVIKYLCDHIWGRKVGAGVGGHGILQYSLITIPNNSDKASLMVYLLGYSNGFGGAKLILRDCKKAWQTYKRRRKNVAEGRYNLTASLSIASKEKLSVLRDRWQLTQDELVELIIDRAFEQDAKRLEKLKE